MLITACEQVFNTPRCDLCSSAQPPPACARPRPQWAGEWTVTLPASQKPGGPAGIALVAGPRSPPPPGAGWVFALLPPAPFSDGTLPPMGPSPPSSAPKDAALGCVVSARVPMGAWGQTRASLEGRGSRQWAAGPGAKEGQRAGQTPALRPPPAPSRRGVGLPSAQPAARRVFLGFIFAIKRYP